MNRGCLIRILLACACLWAIGAGSGLPVAAQAQGAAAARTQPLNEPARFGFGRPATPAEIAAWDIDVRPDGTGLPPGRGTSADGETIYAARCNSCHGRSGKEGPNDVLVGREPREGFTFARDPKLVRTVGSYWPYATTLFDYIRRAMPTDAPGSLQPNDVYALVAFLLVLNDVIPADLVMDATSLPKVVMPAHDRFVPDPHGGPASLRKPSGRR